MKAIRGVVWILGLFASIMALSSLIYGAFSEPLAPYVQGEAGRVMNAYRMLRDASFSELGTLFSGLINEFGRWLSSPAPRFAVPALVKDVLLIYLAIGGAAIRGRRNCPRDAKYPDGSRGLLRRLTAHAQNIGVFLLWPVLGVFARRRRAYREYFWWSMFNAAAGAALFFLLAHGENQAGR